MVEVKVLFSISKNVYGTRLSELKQFPVKTTLEKGWKLKDFVLKHYPKSGLVLTGIVLENEECGECVVSLDKVSFDSDGLSIYQDILGSIDSMNEGIPFSKLQEMAVYTKDGKKISEIKDAILQADATIDVVIEAEKTPFYSKLLNLFSSHDKQIDTAINGQLIQIVTEKTATIGKTFEELLEELMRGEKTVISKEKFADVINDMRSDAFRFVEKMEPITTRRNV